MMQVESYSFLELCWLRQHTTSKSNKWMLSQLFSPILLDEEIYMEQPEAFTDGTDKVCKWERSIYGLKQSASLLWLDERLKEIGFDQTHSEDVECLGECWSGTWCATSYDFVTVIPAMNRILDTDFIIRKIVFGHNPSS